MGTKLFVGNLGKKTTEADLSDLFGEIGMVTGILIPIDHQSNSPKNYAYDSGK